MLKPATSIKSANPRILFMSVLTFWQPASCIISQKRNRVPELAAHGSHSTCEAAWFDVFFTHTVFFGMI